MTHFVRTVRLALKSLMLHKLRSGLTMLGIVFGVFSVIAMLAIGEGASRQAQNQVLELGATNIICVSVKPPEEVSDGSGRSGFGLTYGITHDDFKLLQTVPTLTNAIPIKELTQEVRHGPNALYGRVVGCTPDYFEINHLELSAGRFLSGQDEDDGLEVAVVAQDVNEALFKLDDPLKSSVRVAGEFYTVVGVTKSRSASAAIGGSMSGQEYNKDVYIPLSTFFKHIGERTFRRTSGSFSVETVQLSQVTLQVNHEDNVLKTADTVREILDLNHKKTKDVSVIVPAELLKQAAQIRQIFNIVLGSIAAISLVVGGIGIMNIMLATVTERTREIGIRRALGARRRDITQQFLTETTVLAGTGGIIGVVLGLLTGPAFSAVREIVDRFVLEGEESSSEIGKMFLEIEPEIAMWSLPLAFGISVGIGVIFGLYPAQAAAKLDPIEALRHE